MVAQNLDKTVSSENVEAWFDGMVANLRYDQALLENDILEKSKLETYKVLMSGDHEKMFYLGRETSSMYFITNMVENYFKELVKAQSEPSKIALELSDSKILVWAEIKDGDETMEDALILAEAKTNAYYSKYGFHISSTIVEDSDCLEIPKHYKSIPIVKK